MPRPFLSPVAAMLLALLACTGMQAAVAQSAPDRPPAATEPAPEPVPADAGPATLPSQAEAADDQPGNDADAFTAAAAQSPLAADPLATSSSPDTAPPDDSTLSREVARRLQNADGLDDVTVTVQAGVARLDGKVVGVEDRELAAQIASQQPGVETVENNVQLSTRLSDRFDAAIGLVTDKLLRLVAAIPLLVVAIALVMGSWWLGHAIGRRVGLRRWRSENPYLDGLVQNLVQWLVLLIGVLIALDLLGATALVGAVLGSAGVIGLALGFAFKDIAENYVAGILLSLRRPFAPGDALRIETYEGKVVALTARATILMTYDGNRLSLPNALVFKSVVLDYSRNPKRRFDFVVPVDPATSIGKAQTSAMSEIAATDGVLSDPGPSWAVVGYEGGGINLQFFGWVNQRESDLGKVRSAAINAVKKAFAAACIEGPRSVQYVVSMPVASAKAETVAAEAPADVAPPDTSVNRDMDEQLAAAQRAHSDEDLIPPTP